MLKQLMSRILFGMRAKRLPRGPQIKLPQARAVVRPISTVSAVAAPVEPPIEPLVAYVKVACLAGVLLAMPIILSQLWGFVRAGLSRRERSYGLTFVWWGSVLFAAGVAFAYYVLLPVSLRFLLGIGHGTLAPVISIDTYLSFVTSIAFWCGVLFELPAVLYLLATVGVVTPAWLRQSRPYAILVMVIIAALVTPTTDPVSLLLMAAPMVLLYELSILTVRFAFRPRPLS